MTGPEHFQEAERHLSGASYTNGSDGRPVNPAASAHHLAVAQVHATLALAAATALSDPSRSAAHATDSEWDAWQKVAGISDPDADYDSRDSFA